MSKSADYHDYVFRDGKLVGEFEEMYRNSARIPWHQDEQANWIDVRLTKEMIRDIGQFDEVHDLGCGTGHYLNLISEEALRPSGTGYGYDISQTACHIATELFPENVFSTLDLTENHVPNFGHLREDDERIRLFVIRGTLWYVFPQLGTVIDNIRGLMSAGDSLLVVQNFPPLVQEFVGKEVLPNHSALINQFSKRFSLGRHIWYEDTFGTSNDNWFVGLFQPKDES